MFLIRGGLDFVLEKIAKSVIDGSIALLERVVIRPKQRYEDEVLPGYEGGLSRVPFGRIVKAGKGSIGGSVVAKFGSQCER